MARFQKLYRFGEETTASSPLASERRPKFGHCFLAASLKNQPGSVIMR